MSTAQPTNQSENTQYTNLNQQLLNAFNGTQNAQGGWTAGNFSDFNNRVGTLQSTFASQFQNLVGRAPTQAEIDQFSSQYIAPNVTNIMNPNSPQNLDPSSYINQFVGNNFQQAAQDTATQKLQAQQAQAQQLGQQYMQGAQQGIDATSQYMQNYDQQLFNRLQPQIMTSLQSQGLLNTGGLNEAMAGAQKDLAGQANGYLANAELQAQNQANQIAFGGASAPYQYQQSNYLNQVPYMQQQANTAMGQNYNTMSNALNYQYQLGLQNNYFQQQQNMQPSFMRTLGQGFAGSVGNGLGQWTSPGAGQNQAGTTGNYAGLSGLMG